MIGKVNFKKISQRDQILYLCELFYSDSFLHRMKVIFELSLSVFTEFSDILKRLFKPTTYQDTCRDRIFKLSLVHASVIYQIP